MASKTVYVHGWEIDGSIGFDWFHYFDYANHSYNNAPHHTDRADFLTSYEVNTPENGTGWLIGKEITDTIDAEIDEVLAKATTRRVGQNVLAYWAETGMNMGTATESAKD